MFSMVLGRVRVRVKAVIKEQKFCGLDMSKININYDSDLQGRGAGKYSHIKVELFISKMQGILHHENFVWTFKMVTFPYNGRTNKTIKPYTIYILSLNYIIYTLYRIHSF